MAIKRKLISLVPSAIFECGHDCQTQFLKRTNQGPFWPSSVKFGPFVFEEISKVWTTDVNF